VGVLAEISKCRLAQGSQRPRRGATNAANGLRLAANVLLAVLAGIFVLVFGQWLGDALELVLVPPNGRSIFFTLVLLGVLLAAATLALLVDGEVYIATLVLIAPLVPSFAAALTVLFNAAGAVGTPLREQSLIVAVCATTALSVFGALFLKWMARADTAQPRSYGELMMRALSLRARLEAMAAPSAEQTDPARRSLVAQIQVHLNLLDTELGIGGRPAAGFRYAQASGYINLWRFLHRGEEALIALEPLAWSKAAARTDRLRLTRSTISNRDEMLKDLEAALDVLEAPAAAAACPAPLTAPTPQCSAAPPATRLDAATAVGLLQEIRRAINVSRDDGWRVSFASGIVS
jgi:hypothetical protein